MQERIAYASLGPEPYKAMIQMEQYFHNCSVDTMLLHLVKLRASQMNGCAFCIDMHAKDLIAGGETVQRIYGLDAWREAPYYTDRERAALEWTEALTRIADTHADDEIYERVKPHFTEQELVDITWVIGAINLWNRMAISMRVKVGDYKPPTGSAHASLQRRSG